MGDLNYRFQDDDDILHSEYVKIHCSRQEYQKLLSEYDQLKQMQEKKLAFNDFKEADINFSPTYKYDADSDNWDSSEKARAPAYCDRILYQGSIVTPKRYESIQRIRFSDHRPVRCHLIIKTKLEDKKRRSACFYRWSQESDKRDNAAVPSVLIVGGQEVKFADLRYLEPKVASIPIKNTGKYPVTCRFKRKFDGFVCKDCITLSPPTFTIPVGEETVLNVQMIVSRFEVWALKSDKKALQDVVILDLLHGGDHFISVDGVYTPSCFGEPLEKLVYVAEPAPLIDFGVDENDSNSAQEGLPGVPPQLWRLVEHIKGHVVELKDSSGIGGTQTELFGIIRALDSGVPGPLPGSVFSAMDALMRYLEALPEPLIPLGRHTEDCLRAAAVSPAACWKEVRSLPECHKKTFEYLMEFLRLVWQNSDPALDRSQTARYLCTDFAPLFFRLGPEGLDQEYNLDPKTRSKLVEQRRYSVNFMQNCLTQSGDSASNSKFYPSL